MRLYRFIPLLLFVLFAAVSYQAQTGRAVQWNNGVFEPWFFWSDHYSGSVATEFKNRWSLMENNQIPADEWEGLYAIGDNSLRIRVFRWSQTQGFVYANVNSCMANVEYISYGKVDSSSSLIKIAPEINTPTSWLKGNDAIRYSTVRNNYLRVIWGQRHYLVPEDMIGFFYDYVSGSGIYNFDGDALEFWWEKYEDRIKPRLGMPIFPPGYERYVKRPIDVTITLVKPRRLKRSDSSDQIDYDSITSLRINGGRADGLKSGMHLYFVGNQFQDWEYVEVTSVGQHSSRGTVTRSVDDDKREREDYAPIRAGQKLTSSYYFK